LWGIVNWIVPFFSGFRGPYQAPGVRNWFGVAVLVAAVVALSGRNETKRLHAWVFFGLGALLLVKVYNFGLLEWLGRLPVVERVDFLVFGPPVIAFAFSVLAGIGVQVLWKGDLHVRRFLILLASTLSLLALLVFTGDRWKLITHPSSEYQREVWGRAALFGLLVVISALVFARFKGRWAAALAAGVIIAELFTLAPFSIYAQRADPYATPGWMSFVRAAQRSEPDSRVFAIDAKLFPNTAGALGLQDIRMLDALYVERYWRYVKTFIQPSVQTRFNGGPYASEESSVARFRDNPMFDALAVTAVLSQQDLGNVPALRFIGQDLDTRVYQDTSAYPRAWVVHEVHVVRDEDEAFDFLKARGHREDGAVIVDRFDPRQEAVVERHVRTSDNELGALQDGSTTCTASGRDRVKVQEYSAQTVRLRVEAACAGLLVLPDTFFPGWSASVNNQDRAIYATDGAFRGVTVPKGSSLVEFRYVPRELPIGVVLALIAIVGCVALALFSWWRRVKTPVKSSRGSRAR
jgi:hypothetical protein